MQNYIYASCSSLRRAALFCTNSSSDNSPSSMEASPGLFDLSLLEELFGDGEYFLLFLDFFDLGGSDSAPKIDKNKYRKKF